MDDVIYVDWFIRDRSYASCYRAAKKAYSLALQGANGPQRVIEFGVGDYFFDQDSPLHTPQPSATVGLLVRGQGAHANPLYLRARQDQDIWYRNNPQNRVSAQYIRF